MQKWAAMKFLRSAAMVEAYLVISLIPLCASAQYRRGEWNFGRSYGLDSPEAMREQEMMQKALVPGFEDDTFTFARLKFDADTRARYGRGRVWEDDCPEADLNLTYRLFQVTSLSIRPGLHFIDITTKN